jgi:hypothetical protein
MWSLGPPPTFSRCLQWAGIYGSKALQRIVCRRRSILVRLALRNSHSNIDSPEKGGLRLAFFCEMGTIRCRSRLAPEFNDCPICRRYGSMFQWYDHK